MTRLSAVNVHVYEVERFTVGPGARNQSIRPAPILKCSSLAAIGEIRVADQSNTFGASAELTGEATRALESPTSDVGIDSSDSAAESHQDPPTATPPAAHVEIGQFSVDQPLSTRFRIPPSISRMVIDADREILRDRLESALDLTLAAESEHPGCVGLYVRQAELLLATDRQHAASTVINTISRSADVIEGPSVDVELERILTHANPTDANVLHFAQTLLNAKRTDLIDRYLPVAVEAATLQDDPRLAIEISRRWSEIRPDSLDALFSMTREGLRLGEGNVAEIDLKRIAHHDKDPRALVIWLAVDCASHNLSQWAVTARLLTLIDAKQIEAGKVQSLLREMIAVQPSNESLLVHSGVIEVNVGNPEVANQLLLSVRPADPFAYYVSAVAGARAAVAAGNPVAAAESLQRAMDLHRKPEIADFAASCPLLKIPHDMFSIGKSIAGVLQQQGDAAGRSRLLEKLATLNPEREDLSRAYAEALAKAGDRERAVAQLEQMLRQHEAEGDVEGVILTIQSILQISPGNLRLRGRLIDEFMKRGRLQEAVQERWTQAQILERAGRGDDAIEQLRRAIEVASILGDWKKLESIVQLMIRIRPDNLDVRHSAATKFIEYGQIKLAIEQLWAAVEISTRSDDPDETIAALHQIIALGPDEIDAYHKLGEVLAAVGEYAQAERVYRRLSALVPDDPAIQAKQSALAAMANGSR